MILTSFMMLTECIFPLIPNTRAFKLKLKNHKSSPHLSGDPFYLYTFSIPITCFSITAAFPRPSASSCGISRPCWADSPPGCARRSRSWSPWSWRRTTRRSRCGRRTGCTSSRSRPGRRGRSPPGRRTWLGAGKLRCYRVGFTLSWSNVLML